MLAERDRRSPVTASWRTNDFNFQAPSRGLSPANALAVATSASTQIDATASGANLRKGERPWQWFFRLICVPESLEEFGHRYSDGAYGAASYVSCRKLPISQAPRGSSRTEG
jgi:hypothetical protein